MNTQEYNNTVTTYSGNLYRFMLKMTKDADRANDLVQDAFMKLWEHRADVEAAKAKSWLFTTARNAMLNQLKRDKRMESMELTQFTALCH